MRYFLLFLFLYSCAYAVEKKPYLNYSESELKPIQHLDSRYEITKKDLEKWDKTISEYVAANPLSPSMLVRISAYLYNAQRDFAFLSKQMHGSYQGSLDPLSFGIVRLFYPLFPYKKEGFTEDEFSLALSDIIIAKYRNRLKKEKAAERTTARYLSVRNWAAIDVQYGKKILGWMPWVLPSLVLNSSPPPPDQTDTEFWQSQLNEASKAHHQATEEQTKIVQRWGNFFELGNIWLTIGNANLFSHPVSLEDTLYIRSVLAMAIFDTLIVAFQGKYAYSIRPPYMIDRTINPYIDYSYYPSYPSVHTMVAYVSAYVLGTFFPENKSDFEKLAQEIANSRLWAGMNYPIDIKVAQEVAEQIYENFVVP